jgi:hypothetical protein
MEEHTGSLAQALYHIRRVVASHLLGDGAKTFLSVFVGVYWIKT